MGSKLVRILKIRRRTHNVLSILTEKPTGFDFVPGQAARVYINRPGWETKGLSLAIASLPKNDYLEFFVKTNALKDAVLRFLNLMPGDRLILTEAFGEMTYRGSGTFIAGGVGIAPIISILRDLENRNMIGDNRLIYANRTKADIVFEKELKRMLGCNFINILSEEKAPDYAYGLISDVFLKKSGLLPDDHVYLCGPPTMMTAVEGHLARLGIDRAHIVE